MHTEKSDILLVLKHKTCFIFADLYEWMNYPVCGKVPYNLLSIDLNESSIIKNLIMTFRLIKLRYH